MYDGAISPEKAVRVLMKEFVDGPIFNNKYAKSRTIKCYARTRRAELTVAVQDLMEQYGIPEGKDGFQIKGFIGYNSFIVRFAYPVLKG